MSHHVPPVAPECAQSYSGPSLAESCPGTTFLTFMALLNNLICSKREKSQICEHAPPITLSQYDFIVVGGGSAGAVVARRLSDEPEWKVLLLEAGPDEPPVAQVPSMAAIFLGSEIDWQYSTTNEVNACLSNGGSCYWPLGKNLGGTSVHNYMKYIRGHAKDYDDWADMGNAKWRWSDVLPFFKYSENNTDIEWLDSYYHGTVGPLNVGSFSWSPPVVGDILNAAVEKGYGTTKDLNGDQITGFTIAQATVNNGVRVSSSSAFLRPVRNRRNLDIVLNATVTRILIKNSRAVGVEYVQDGQLRTVGSYREVIISAGAVNSPKLLLLSGIGPKAHLNAVRVPVVKDLPGVGKNLHNHVGYRLDFAIDEPYEDNLNWDAVLAYMDYQTGPMTSTGLSQVTGIVASSYTTPDHPDLQLYFGGYQVTCNETGDIGAPLENGRRIISISPTNLHPLSRGNIRLASNDPMAKPIIWGNYLGHPRDADVIVEGIGIAFSLMNSTAMAKHNPSLTIEPIDACLQYSFLSDDYWKCVIRYDTGPENHQAGSCKMGPANDSLAVVDSELRVHGIRDLRVADASIMPRVTSGNTAAPAMMIGERAASFIKWNIVLPPWSRKGR